MMALIIVDLRCPVSKTGEYAWNYDSFPRVWVIAAGFFSYASLLKSKEKAIYSEQFYTVRYIKLLFQRCYLEV